MQRRCGVYMAGEGADTAQCRALQLPKLEAVDAMQGLPAALVEMVCA